MNDRPVYDPADQVWLRLVAHYGHERALRIMQGKDPATEADIAAWRALGEPKSNRPPEVA